jgi:hypothetical protein
VLIALSAAGVWWWRTTHVGGNGSDAARNEDPRLTFATLYRNVRPDVRSVGDDACADCHGPLCRSYHEHPMGRSFAPTSDPGAPGRLGPDGRAEFTALGFHYRAERRDGRLFHREMLPGPDDKDGDAVEVEVGYVIGSGRRGAGYLFADKGALFQSPISWYAEASRWDLSPGYHERHAHFSRPVGADCLFCHCNQAEPIPDTVNRYREPAFRGYAIGCERCHGPGDLHVRERGVGGGPVGDLDPTIVNPRRLEPALREAVCQQCHLQGAARVLRAGREAFDYRPGLPLESFWAVYVSPPEASGQHKAVGQVEQMYQSRCFTASSGRLGCASCHDPHQDPPQEQRAAFYRGRCLNCHQTADCTAPAPARREKADSCAACHMTRLTETDVVHVAITDHRILRSPNFPPASAPMGSPRGAPLVAFHSGPYGPGDRDLGLAMTQLARRIPPGAGRAYLDREAVPLLQAATKHAPDDLAAWEQLGASLLVQGRAAEALTTCETALGRAPDREAVLATAADAAAQLGRTDDAVAYWRRAVMASPRRWWYHYRLGQALSERRELVEAVTECDAALKLNPASVEARMVRMACLLDLGRKGEARTAFAALLPLKPPREEELRRWFDAQLRLGAPQE